MSLNLLKPQHGLPKKPSDIRDNLQHLLGAALPDCILPENDNTFGFKITSQTGLTVRVGAGRGIIGKKYHDDRNYHDIILPARRACLLYKLKNTATDSVTPSDGYVEAKIPIDMIDNNTVGFWDFTNSDTVSATPNSAVGISSIAVANNIVWTNPTPGTSLKKVDGHCGYAMQGDGATGYGVSANYTGFPVGINKFHYRIKCKLNSISVVTQALLLFGTWSANNCLNIVFINNKLNINNYTTSYDTGFECSVNAEYLFDVTYDGTTVKVYVNGSYVYSLTIALNIIASALSVLKFGSYYSSATVDFVELFNDIKTPEQIAQTSNNLLLPCSYQTPQSPVPLMTANSSQGSVALASSEYSVSNKAFMAFRKGSVLGDVGWCASTSTGYLQITLPSSFTPKYVDVQSIASLTYGPKDFTIYGSNDAGITKTTLLTITGATWTANERKRLYILGSSAYTTLGINVTANNGATYLQINDLDFGTDVVSTTDIRSILPADSISLGLVKTGSSGVDEIETKKRKTGRIEGATGGNRRADIEWKYVTAGITKNFDNPFGTENITCPEVWFKKSLTDSKHSVIDSALYTTSYYGCWIKCVDSNKITVQIGTTAVIIDSNSYTLANESAGYIALANMEVIE